MRGFGFRAEDIILLYRCGINQRIFREGQKVGCGGEEHRCRIRQLFRQGTEKCGLAAAADDRGDARTDVQRFGKV